METLPLSANGFQSEAGYRAVAPDQRGYTPQARPPGVHAYRLELLVSDVLAMADRIGQTRALRAIRD